jgi:hypothetical protein
MRNDFMAGKTKNRMELRRQHEAAEDLDPMEDVAAVEDVEDEEIPKAKAKKKKAPAKPKVKVPKAPKPSARMRVAWAVVNDAFKTVATFEYTQKEAALAKAKELTEKGTKGTFFVQRVKEAMPDDAPGLGATIARATPAPVTHVSLKDDDEAAEEPREDEDDDDDESMPDDDED